jgi:hypothetical protein
MHCNNRILYKNPRRVIRCRTKESIIHDRLDRFFQRHNVVDYSEQKYVYTVTRINRGDSENTYVEITYMQYSCIYDSPTKEIVIVMPSKRIIITDNFSENMSRRYQYCVQQ